MNRVVIDGDRATGVAVRIGGENRVIGATSEVVLCAGGINTAQILMLSGIGAAADLRAHGIEVIADSPEVGANFQDHILHGGCLWESHEPQAPRNNSANATGFWKSDSALTSPDINIVQIEIPYASEVLAGQYGPPPSSWALCAGLVAPKSRGRMTLAGTPQGGRAARSPEFTRMWGGRTCR